MTNRGTQRGFGRREGQPFINREHRTDVPNSVTAYSITPDDRYVCCIGTSALQPVYTLPPAALVRRGAIITVVDDAGVINPYAGGFSITIKVQTNPYANDTINGGTVPVVITAPRGYVVLEPDGVSNWTILDQTPDYQWFTGNGTWTKRPGYNRAYVWLVGPGGGGGSGRCGTGGASAGGCGGGGGNVSEAHFNMLDLGATESVVCPAGVTGATAVGTAAANGNNGGSGASGPATFGGTKLQALPGAGGNGGATTDFTSTGQWVGWPFQGNAGGPGKATAVAGGAGLTSAADGPAVKQTTSSASGMFTYGPGGGGGGAGGSALPLNGGAGGAPSYGPSASTFAAGGVVSTSAAGAGSTGGPLKPGGGGGGGCGANTAAVTGQAGGNGGFPGGGGGGGGGCVSAGTAHSGAGGNGGNSACLVVSEM